MHTLFLLSALLLAAAVSALGALLLRLTPAEGRRSLALVVLGAPLFTLALAAFHVMPLFWTECSPLVGWDRVASLGILAGVGGVALGALAINLSRLLLIERLLSACPPLRSADLEARTGALADQLGLRAPALRLLRLDAPLALGGGLRRPTIVVSSWLIDQLDRRELDGVLGHELGHLARRDHLTRALGRLLRDATVYLPGAWYALRALEADEELSADALAVGLTGRPLAMASALGKVWRAAMANPRPAGFAGLPAYAGTSPSLMEERLSRLLAGRTRPPSRWHGRLVAGAAALSVGGITPQLLVAGSSAMPLVCMLPRGLGL